MNKHEEIAILAGGCFWGMQDLLRKIKGMKLSEVGYTGGQLPQPKYENVKTGNTGHAEAIRLSYDSSVLSYGEILEWFFKMHDPTTMNQQGNDIGSQYRSAIFYLNDAQKLEAEKHKLKAQELWKKPIVTQIVAATEFYPAEEFHQDYLEKHPNGYTCHYIRSF